MRFRDIKIIESNKGSNVVRYNTELAMLTAFSGGTTPNDIPDGALVNPKETRSEIKKVASLPGSKDPIYSSTPKISAAESVIDLSASFLSKPQEYAFIASSGKVLTCPSIG